MADATEARIATEEKADRIGTAPMAASATAYIGLLALLTSGYYDSATLASADYCAGVIIEPPNIKGYDNSDGAAGDLDVRFARTGLYPFDLSSGDTPTLAHIGAPLFAEDNQTVTLEPFHLTRKRPYVGRLAFVLNSQAWVDLDPARTPTKEELGAYRSAPVQSLLAATLIVINPYQDFYPVVGNGGAVILTGDLPSGLKGHPFTIAGTSDANTVTVQDNKNTKLAGSLPMLLANGSTLTLAFDGTDDVEISRSDNA